MSKVKLRKCILGLCPYCDSHNTNYESTTIESGMASQEANCLDCEARWIEYYELTNYERVG